MAMTRPEEPPTLTLSRRPQPFTRLASATSQPANALIYLRVIWDLVCSLICCQFAKTWGISEKEMATAINDLPIASKPLPTASSPAPF